MALAYSISRTAAKPRRSVASGRIEAVDPYEMTKLFPRTTGLPLTIWAGPRGRARHDARIKVSLMPGKMDTTHTAVVGIGLQSRVVRGRMDKADFDRIAQWILLNEDALMALWDGGIDGVEFAGRLRKLDAVAE